VFGRTKTPPAPAPELPAKDGGKGRPTPKRSASEAANRRPLVATDRRGASATSREAVRDARRRAAEGRLAGDDRYLAARDRGPVRRFVRDVVDSRRNAGEWFLVFVLICIVLQLATGTAASGVNTLVVVTYGLLYAGVIVVVIDSLRLRSLVRRRVRERFGEAGLERGLVSYAVMRALQLRRSRVPRAVVRHGEQPR
jgi:hypothetical protein